MGKSKYMRIFCYLITIIRYTLYFKKTGSRNIIKKPILITRNCISIGSKAFIRNGARIEGVKNYIGKTFNPSIEIGDNVHIEQNLHLTCAESVTIGQNTSISANVTITDIIHPYENIRIAPEFQSITTDPVRIGNDCKIYNNAVILPGAIIGKHCVIGANSVLRRGVYPDYSIIVGSPAIIIKQYSQELNKWVNTHPKRD